MELEPGARRWASGARVLRHHMLHGLGTRKHRPRSSAAGSSRRIVRPMGRCCADSAGTLSIGPRDPDPHRGDVMTSAASALTTCALQAGQVLPSCPGDGVQRGFLWIWGEGLQSKGRAQTLPSFKGLILTLSCRDELGSFLGLPVPVCPVPPSQRLALRAGCSWSGRPRDPHSRAPR